MYINIRHLTEISLQRQILKILSKIEIILIAPECCDAK